MKQGAMVGVKDDHAYVWDPASSHTIEVLTLAELWARGATEGGPPDSGIEAMAVTPPGPATMEYLGNELLVSLDGGLWSLQWDGGPQVWTEGSFSAIPNFPVASVESATIFRLGEIPTVNEQVMLIASGDQLYWYRESIGWSSPRSATAFFCATGSEAPCPMGAMAMSRIPPAPDAGSSGASILVQHDGNTYVASIQWNASTNAPEFSAWTVSSPVTMPCNH
jgi:hypothetical protein